MAASGFNFFKEKLILLEEEKQLKKMLEKFQDQQNRLKIEELALMSLIKMEEEKGKLERMQHADDLQQPSTSYPQPPGSDSDAASFVPVGFMTDDASTINTESLNLDVGPPIRHREPSAAGGEEEEEEEDDDDSDDDRANDKVDALSAAESHQLMSFMEDF